MLFKHSGYHRAVISNRIKTTKKFQPFRFVKIDTSVLKEMTYPYFTNKKVNIEGHVENCSEDVSFCLDSPIKPKIIRDLRIGHMKSTVV